MTPPTQAAERPWVAKSDVIARETLQTYLRFDPESGSLFGLPGSDERVLDLGPDLEDRVLAAFGERMVALRALRADERDRFIAQDLELMIDALERAAERVAAERAILLPYGDRMNVIFEGLRILLDERNDAARRALALRRLAAYAGLAPGTTPLLELAAARWRERAGDPALLGPFRGQVEKDRANAPTLLDGIGPLFVEAGVDGWQAAHAALARQAAAYDGFVRDEVLPRARADFRLPPDLYALALRDVGVDMPAAELANRAEVAFREIQNEMQALAPLVARERGLAATDYRAVLGALKQQQFVGEAILPHYRARLADIEAIIRREGIVSLPAREASIRLAGPAESAASPAPHMDMPRMMGNTGERGVFVLPLAVPGRPGEQTLPYDDFTFEAASWTLTAHEARPGHELQFAAMVEVGVSLARQLFALNSTNAEGWALYMEAEMKPYEPLEGQLVALQHRLMRAARAFLDPGLQAGTITPEVATRILREDVVLSEAMALQEVERTLGARFVRRRYHDFILAQGVLPPDLLRRAVLQEFVPGERAAG